MKRLGIVLATLGLSIAHVRAQGSRTVAEGRIGPYQTIATSGFDVRQGEGITVDVVASDSRLQASVSALDSTSNLMEKQGNEHSSLPQPFRWVPDAPGQYHLQIRNLAAAEGVFSVRLVSGQTPRGESVKNYAEVRVYYGTNRARSGKSFGSNTDQGQLHYGVATVSIPRDHRMGGLESNAVSRLFPRAPNPSEEVAMLKIEDQAGPEFFNGVQRRVLPSEKKSVLVFVHGFNVAFEEAIRRVAQIAYDLHYDGAPIVFSWPSAGEPSPVAYAKDGDAAELSVPALESLLLQVQKDSGAGSLQLMAHSMGNRILLRALERIALKQSDTKGSPLISEVIFMAPDVEAKVFRQASSAALPVGRRFTLYASDNDSALRLSQRMHGAPRAGQGGAQTLVINGIDSIDASKVNTDFGGHGYYGDSTSILYDLDQLFQGRPASKRLGLRQVRNSHGSYWEFIAAAN